MKNSRFLLSLVLAGLWLSAGVARADEAEPSVTPEPIDGYAETDATIDAPNVHGFITTRYMNADGAGLPYSSESSFDIQFARINLDGNVHPLVAYLIAFETADIKFASGVPLREAYVIWSPGDQFERLRPFIPKVRLGRMRRPGGIESSIDENQLVAIDRSIYSGFMHNDDPEAPDQDYRDIGFRGEAVSGPIEVTALGMVNGNSAQSNSSQPADEDPDKDVMGRVGFKGGIKDLFYLRAGMSTLSGSDVDTHLYSATGGERIKYTTVAYDATVVMGPLLIMAEVARGTRTVVPLGGGPADTATGAAGYLLVSYGFGPGGQTRPFTRIAYRELTLNDNKDDFRRPRDWGNEVTVGVNYQIIKKRLIARGQYTLRSGFIPPHPSNGAMPGFSKTMSGLAAASIQVEY